MLGAREKQVIICLFTCAAGNGIANADSDNLHSLLQRSYAFLVTIRVDYSYILFLFYWSNIAKPSSDVLILGIHLFVE